MLSYLHQILLGCGFSFTKVQQLPKDTPLSSFDRASGFYVKDYETSSGTFQVALSFRGDPHIELPWACVLSYPEQYIGKLIPHLNFGWFLCYVQQMEADWDSNDLLSTYKAVDAQISDTLNKAVESIDAESDANAEALEGEFSAYWLPEKTVYLLSEPVKGKSLHCQITVKKSPSSRERKPNDEEWVVYHQDNSTGYQKWLEQRELETIGSDFLAHYVCVKPSCLVGVNWPPKSFGALLEWLAKVDPGGRSKILDCISRNPVKRHVILLDVFQQDIIGLCIDIDLKVTPLNRCSKGSKRRNKNGSSMKLSKLATSLSGKRGVLSFGRLGVIRADQKSILNRNRQRPEIGNLSLKRVALIGCGTIGGHLASLLLRAGAGCGSSHFHLFDDDTYNPQNFGRHPLATSDFGSSKSVALASTLHASTHISCNIRGTGKSFKITPEELKNYDIVIDATGRPPVSRRLASVTRELPENKRPILIHGFNDGNGRASKVFVDNGDSCYGCMNSEPAFYKRGVDLRFNNIDLLSERHVSCGSAYTPYDAAVSVITAGLMQEAALNCLEDQFPWTYSEHMFDGNRPMRPKFILKQQSCEICND